MAKTAILGATGPTGIHLAAALHQSGTPMRVVARGKDKLDRLFPDAAIEKMAGRYGRRQRYVARGRRLRPGL